MESNSILIQKFYSAFQNLDPEAMAACYHDQVQFQDPVFNKLSGKDPSDMWRMLISRGGASLKYPFPILYQTKHQVVPHGKRDTCFQKQTGMFTTK